MKTAFIDTHVHLAADEYQADFEAMIERAKASGVQRFISIGAGTGLDSAERALTLANSYDCIWASVGVHPHDAGQNFSIDRMRKLAQSERVVAIGETGLDYFKNFAPREDQHRWFKAQIELALELKKPLIIHSREAGADCYQLLTQGGAKAVGGVFHCYSEDHEFAKKLREINFLVSIPGSLTFKKAQALRDTVKAIPLEQLMLETDGPFLAPEPYRGKRCESAFMMETARMMAELKELSLEELAAITSNNACKLFGLPAI